MMTHNKLVRSIHVDNLTRLAPRGADTHKGQLGHVLIIAGDLGMGGAGLLSTAAQHTAAQSMGCSRVKSAGKRSV